MPGFNLVIGKKKFKKRADDLFRLQGSIIGEGYEINRFTLNKFVEDKIFFKSDSYVILLEGVVLNRRSLTEESESWLDTIVRLYESLGETFYKEFRGSFSGVFFDVQAAKWVIFTDHLATKHIYYHKEGEDLCVSSELTDFFPFIKGKIDSEAAYMLLSYGYMLKNKTLLKNVFKLEAGGYIVVDKKKFEIKKYYQLPLSSDKGARDENEMIEELDKRFRNAIQLQFEKDKEYGYRHLVGLSGGLDSRMTSWVANDMGYKSQINFTFSQSDYLDETIAKRISAALKHEWLFKALDNGTFLEDIDEITQITGGNVLYYGLAHANSLYKLLDFDGLGLIHTGQLGDVVVGSFIKNFSQKSLDGLGGAYSVQYKNKIKEGRTSFNSFAELESALIYQRGLNGANNGLLSAQYYSETMSPFYDIDFFEYCLSIPISFRMSHNIYKKWILNKYPGAAEYIWESTKRKINKSVISVRIGTKRIPLTELGNSFLRKLGLKKAPVKSKFHMNPLDYWYETNPSLKAFQDRYFSENKKFIAANKSLLRDCEGLYVTGSGTEKNQVLSLVAAGKLIEG